MRAFLYAEVYKYNIFGICDDNTIWRIWMDGYHPLMEELMGNESEWSPVVQLLKLRVGLYR